MNKVDEADLKVCAAQGDIFELSAKKCPCSSPIFIRRFMNSKVAEEIDSGAFLSGALSSGTVISRVTEEYGESNYGSAVYDPNELHWIGFMYRYLALAAGRSSRQIFKAIGARELRSLYFTYHSLSPERAAELILQEKEVPTNEEELTARGVEVLRRIIKNNPNDPAYQYFFTKI